MEIRRRFERGPTSVGAIVPDLPGYFAIAPTMTEAQNMVAEVIDFHIRCLRDAGDSQCLNPLTASKAVNVSDLSYQLGSPTTVRAMDGFFAR